MTDPEPADEFDAVLRGWSERRPWWRRAGRRPPVIVQSEEMDCGPACGVMLARHYGADVDLAVFRPLVRSDAGGTNLALISEGLERVGLQTFAFELSGEELSAIREPFVTALGHHFVVVWRVTPGTVEVADPAVGPRVMARADFERAWQKVCVFAKPTSRLTPEAGDPRRGLRLLPLVRRYRHVLALLLVLSLGLSALALASTYLTKILLDDVIPAGELGFLKVFALALASIALLSQVLGAARDLIVVTVATRIQVAFSVDLYRHLLSVSYLRLATKVSGDILGRMRDVATVRGFVTEQFLEIVINALFFVVALAFISVVSPQMAVVAVATGLASVVISLASSRMLYAKNQEMFVQNVLGDQLVIEQTRNFLVLKCFGAEAVSLSKWKRQLDRSTALALSLFRRTKALDVVAELVATLGTGTVAVWGAWLVIQGQLTLGTLVAIGTLYAMVVAPMQKLADVIAGFQAVRSSKDRVNEVLAIPPEQVEGAAAAVHSGRLEFEDVSFAYGADADGEPVLRNLTFTIQEGEIVGLVGPSGAGKTTLSLLIARVLGDYSGTIRIGGVDSRELDLRRLRKLVGLVTQDPGLLGGTILENICVGDVEPAPDKARWAARLAQADEFIGALPGGYGFHLGQAGLGLSGGQRQRLAIARALYHDPKILILDEMTSALDRETERRLLASLKPVVAGRTVLVISHRISALRLCGRVLLLHQGQLEADGPLEKLRATHIGFQRLMLDELIE